uniref:Uncharacterized protein n=1 Tax=Tanacetum cinerariifolium TaxID=118510 RepID=A0A699L6P6_TANCI|nr:hypothetical protein [Tanacetum cinerariifolium]
MDDVSNQERMIADIDAEADVVLEEAKDVADDAKDDQDADVQVNADIQRRTAYSQVEIYKIDLDHANKVLSITTITAADVSILSATTAAAPALIVAPISERYFDSNVAFLQKTKEQIDEEESRALKRINETPAEKVTKRQKLDKEVEELKRHFQIVPNDKDDVYTEATLLLARIQEKHAKCLMLLVKDLMLSSQDDAID